MKMNYTSDIGPKHIPLSWRDTVLLLGLTFMVIKLIQLLYGTRISKNENNCIFH